MVAEHADDLFGLVEPHQPVIDEDAGELVADRFVDQHGGDRGVDAARQAADHPALADLGADLLDHAAAIGRHRPVGFEPDDVVNEISEQLAAVWRVHHLRVEHRCIAFRLLVHRDREGRVGRGADDLEAGGQLGDAVAMAHPDRVAATDFPHARVECARLLDLDVGAAELASVAALDLAAELQRKRLLAVADGKDRHARIEHRLRRARAALVGHRGGPARKDHALGT